MVTGTLIAGKVKKEEEVEVFPSRKRARVRGVQVHGSAADHAIAGQHTALNLAGVQMEELTRGMTLAAPGVFEPTQNLKSRFRCSKMPSHSRTAHVFTSTPFLQRRLPKSHSAA